MKYLPIFFLTLLLLASCRGRSEESKESPCFVRQNANLELYADSANLELLPVKDTYATLRKGEKVAVAEWDIHPGDSIDSVWIKVVHSAERQGWIRQKELNEDFVPTDSISQFIHFFSGVHEAWFATPVLLFFAFFLYRIRRNKPVHILFYRDIESLYPVLLSLFISTAAVLYGSIQRFAPEIWLHYYYNPTLSPFDVQVAPGFFLGLLWLALIVGLAAVDDAFRKFAFLDAILYLWGLVCVCICCYFLFVYLIPWYFGYLILLLLFVLFANRLMRMNRYKYRCGNCGRMMKSKGVCPNCGAVNE